jgi:hypothetical protein
LKCGIIVGGGRPGFAQLETMTTTTINDKENAILVNTTTITEEWEGLDVDFCRTVASGMFKGNITTLKFVPVSTEDAGFDALADTDVDVLAGASFSL